MGKVLVTGYNGFVGKGIVGSLGSVASSVVLLGRHPSGSGAFYFADIGCDFDCSEALVGVDVVLHCAALTHAYKGEGSGSRPFHAVNVGGTLSLARQAAAAGVKRFVFISSIGVNGAFSCGSAFTEADSVNPYDFYTESKLQAEKGLLELVELTGLEVVIVRPPLVYGPGCPGMFSLLMRVVKSGVPLPLGSLVNKRSMIALDNLVDFILLCVDIKRSREAANQVFVISDDFDISIKDLLKKMAKAYGKHQCLVPFPVSLMMFTACLMGQKVKAGKFFSDLNVDCSKAKSLLGWRPVTTIDEQLSEMVRQEDDACN
ncbi:UDP-glucose 4-epimerase [gamma proteobacterium IMCC1989]|nr:UDP-glucose 4-epimerase [gamma proteobacterium IMCC1989]